MECRTIDAKGTKTRRLALINVPKTNLGIFYILYIAKSVFLECQLGGKESKGELSRNMDKV